MSASDVEAAHLVVVTLLAREMMVFTSCRYSPLFFRRHFTMLAFVTLLSPRAAADDARRRRYAAAVATLR